MAEKTKQITAIEALRRAVTIAEQIVEAGKAYLDVMDRTPRVKVEVGGYYRTFDGSYVYVARRRDKCSCAICGGQVQEAATEGPFGGLLASMGFKMPGSASPRDHQDDKPEFMAVILKGGHGIKDTTGEEPGDPYFVDQDGLIVMAERVDDKAGVVTRIELAVAGLSFKERVQVVVG